MRSSAWVMIGSSLWHRISPNSIMSIFAIDSIFPNSIKAPQRADTSSRNHSTLNNSSFANADKETRFGVSSSDTAIAPGIAAREENKASSDGSGNQQLSQQDKQQITELDKRDKEVRAHEAAHRSAGGGLTQPASFSYQTGPDGRRYAVGGEVRIDTSAVPHDPQATLLKANRIHAAALAPVQPSSQDHHVAAQAAAMANQARIEMAQQQQKNVTSNTTVADKAGTKPEASKTDSLHGTANEDDGKLPAHDVKYTNPYAQINSTAHNQSNAIDLIA